MKFCFSIIFSCLILSFSSSLFSALLLSSIIITFKIGVNNFFCKYLSLPAKTEFSKLIDVLGLEISDKRQNELLRDLDKEGNGTIDYDEFVNLMTRFQFGNAETHLETAFNEYDKDMDGEVGLDDLLKVSEELDEVQMSKSDAELMIAFFKYFSQEKMHENDEDMHIDEINSVNITKKEFITTLTRINFLVHKSDNNNNISNDPNKSRGSGFYESKSGMYSKSGFDKTINDKSKDESQII